jgi:hypothetical protein
VGQFSRPRPRPPGQRHAVRGERPIITRLTAVAADLPADRGRLRPNRTAMEQTDWPARSRSPISTRSSSEKNRAPRPVSIVLDAREPVRTGAGSIWTPASTSPAANPPPSQSCSRASPEYPHRGSRCRTRKALSALRRRHPQAPALRHAPLSLPHKVTRCDPATLHPGPASGALGHHAGTPTIRSTGGVAGSLSSNSCLFAISF